MFLQQITPYVDTRDRDVAGLLRGLSGAINAVADEVLKRSEATLARDRRHEQRVAALEAAIAGCGTTSRRCAAVARMPDARDAAGPRFAMSWRGSTLRLAALAVPLGLTLTVLSFNVGPAIKLIAGVMFALSLVSPAHGLLLTVAAAPLGQLLPTRSARRASGSAKMIVLAFFSGWLLRAHQTGRGRASPRRPPAGCSRPRFSDPWPRSPGSSPDGALPATVDRIVHGYFYSSDRIGFVDAARLLEGLGLAAAAVALFRARPSLAGRCPPRWRRRRWSPPRPAWPSGSAAAAIGSPSTCAMSTRPAATSLWCSASRSEWRFAHGRRRAAWLAASAAIWVGLWFSRSRTAFASTGIVMVVAAIWYAVGAPRHRASAPRRSRRYSRPGSRWSRSAFTSSTSALDYRQQFYQTSARMIAARPLFGVGIGQYYPTSALFLSPQLAWNYGFEERAQQLPADRRASSACAGSPCSSPGSDSASRAPRGRSPMRAARRPSARLDRGDRRVCRDLVRQSSALGRRSGVRVLAAVRSDGGAGRLHTSSSDGGDARGDRAAGHEPASLDAAAAAVICRRFGRDREQPSVPPATQASTAFTMGDRERRRAFSLGGQFASFFVPGDATHVRFR